MAISLEKKDWIRRTQFHLLFEWGLGLLDRPDDPVLLSYRPDISRNWLSSLILMVTDIQVRDRLHFLCRITCALDVPSAMVKRYLCYPRGVILESYPSSWMGVADDCKDIFLELQRKKTHRYVIFKIDEKRKEVVVEKTGAVTETYDDFMTSLPENDCRYAVFDFEFVTEENCQKSKIFFIAWSPSTSRIRAKMLYATSKDRFRRDMDGVHYEIQATDPTELDLEILRERAH